MLYLPLVIEVVLIWLKGEPIITTCIMKHYADIQTAHLCKEFELCTLLLIQWQKITFSKKH